MDLINLLAEKPVQAPSARKPRKWVSERLANKDDPKAVIFKGDWGVCERDLRAQAEFDAAMDEAYMAAIEAQAEQYAPAQDTPPVPGDYYQTESQTESQAKPKTKMPKGFGKKARDWSLGLNKSVTGKFLGIGEIYSPKFKNKSVALVLEAEGVGEIRIWGVDFSKYDGMFEAGLKVVVTKIANAIVEDDNKSPAKFSVKPA